MSVPPNVPAGVPRVRGLPRPPRYLTGTPARWRFQLRIPTGLLSDSAKPHSAVIIRASLGSRPRRDAERLAGRLAVLCRTVFDAALDGRTMSQSAGLDGAEADLVAQVVAACQAAIANAMANPREALGLARGLDAALTTLKLVEGEVGKGPAGLPAVVANSEVLTRGALIDVLRLAPDPKAGTDALSRVIKVAPSLATDRTEKAGLGVAAPAMPEFPVAAQVGAMPEPGAGQVPTFSQLSAAYIQMRIARDGGETPEIGSLRMRSKTFLDLIGDRPVDRYYPRDLQAYINQMQFWPQNVTKRKAFEGQSAREIILANQGLMMKPISRKALEDGYVANIKTILRHGIADYNYRDPVAGAKLSWPQNLTRSRPREGIGTQVRNAVFRNGVASGLLDEALMPLLATLTGRRLGLLLYLRGSDIREKHGVAVAQTDGIVLQNGAWQRVPVKTNESMVFFVLHDFLREIGFVDWARRQEGWIFAQAHTHADPSKYMSKVLNRAMRRAGAAGRHVETFHSMRGDAIDEMREEAVDSRTRRLQAGHELGDEHERYGHRALSATACRHLASLPLDPSLDWSVFRNLDFDRLAAGKRARGRRPRHT